MIKRSRSRRLRIAGVIAAAALAAPLVGITPALATTPTAPAVPSQSLPTVLECEHDSRDIDASNARDRTRVIIDGDEVDRAEITLRSNTDGSCWWALSIGRSQMWLETVPLFDGLPDGASDFKHPKSNEAELEFTHNAAFVSKAYAIRACGRGWEGVIERSETIRLDGEVTKTVKQLGGKVLGSFERFESTEGNYKGSKRCTHWRTADNPDRSYGGTTRFAVLPGSR